MCFSAVTVSAFIACKNSGSPLATLNTAGQWTGVFFAKAHGKIVDTRSGHMQDVLGSELLR